MPKKNKKILEVFEETTEVFEKPIKVVEKPLTYDERFEARIKAIRDKRLRKKGEIL